MTSPEAMAVGLFTNLTYGIPLLLIGIATLAWFLIDRGRFPPRFEPTRPNRDWLRGPTAAVYESLQAHRYSPAIDYAAYRAEVVLGRRFGVALVPRAPGWWQRRRLPATARQLLRSAAALDRAYRLARLAETSDPNDPILRWRRPAWEARARTLFERALSELGPLLPPLEEGL